MTELDPTLAVYRSIAMRIERAIRIAADARDGYPSGGSGAAGGTSDRTGTIAVRHVDGGDRHGEFYADLERAVMRLADLVNRAAPNNRASEHLAASTPEAARRPDECPSCWRDGGYRAKVRADGRMCRWCDDWARELKADMPPLMLVELHHQGRRITDRDVRIAMNIKR
jgi:hypothetical protein